MNLSDVKLKLFKAEILNLTFIDEFGEHIGDNLPGDRSIFRRDRAELHVAAKSIKDVADFLQSHSINATSIAEVDILLEVSNESNSNL